MCGVTSVHSHQTRTMTSQGYVYLLWPRYCLILVTFQLNFNAQQSTQQNLCLLWSSESWLEVGRRLVFALKQTLVNFRYQKLIREFSVTSHFMGINPRNHFCVHTIITTIGRQCLGVTQDKCVDCKVAELSHCPCWPNCSVSAGHLVFAVNISRCMSPCLHNCLVIGYCFLLRTCNFSQMWKLYSNDISARYCDVTCWMTVARYFEKNL